MLGPQATVRLRARLRGFERPSWGNLRRITPFSQKFGADRGVPIDRYYLKKFLIAHRAVITGDVLEIQGSEYTNRYGHDLRRTDSVDIVAAFEPTFLCDLAHCGGVIPDASYDCILLPQTLPHLRELDAALGHVLRILRPGGMILASAACLIPMTDDRSDYWRFTPEGWRDLLGRVWTGADIDVIGHGNCLAAAASQFGLSCEELTDAELNEHDPRYPVIVTMVCRRPIGSASISPGAGMAR